jgi:N-acetylmuramoyl-L-alanine amidase
MIKQSNYIGLLGLLFAVFDVEATQVNLTGISFNEQQPEKLVFELSGNVKHHYFTLDKPDRLVLDLDNTRQINKLLTHHPLVLNVRSSVRNTNDLRVVIELKSTVDAKTSVAEKANGSLLSVEMHAKESSVKVAKDTVVKPSLPVANAAPVVPVVAVAKNAEPKAVKTRGREIIVAIDAGHGGKDVGAQGSNGTQEKDVVFAIAKRLEGYVNAQSGMKALMIRNGDYFVKLHERVNIARAAKADLFVSIHADAFNDTSAHGASVYTLAKKGASSEGARWLAESENASDKNAGATVDAGDDMLNSVLLDLSQTAAKEASLNVGNRVLNNIQSVSHLHRQSLQKAGFVVLKSQEFPSILVETAFISNPDEEQRLNTTAYQDKMASALFRGIMAHFKQYAPSNTLFAQLSKRGGVQLAKTVATPPVPVNAAKPVAEAVVPEKSIEVAAKSQHVINQGETLSGIAQQYGISMRALRMANGLEDGQVRVGQVLQIPVRISRSS